MADLSDYQIKQRLRDAGVGYDPLMGREELLTLYNQQSTSPASPPPSSGGPREAHDLGADRRKRAPTNNDPSRPALPDVPQISMQNGLLMAMVAYFLYSNFFGSQGGATGGGGEVTQFSISDTSYLEGRIAEVATFEQFQSALVFHKEATGLPVIVDFYSQSCGPCHMIAPAYKALAKEFKQKAAFLKVDVNRNHATSSHCGVRSMPTFQFYMNDKKVNQFSGADSNRLRQVTVQMVEQAARQGTWPGQVVTKQALQAFYTTHDAAKSEAELDDIMAKYGPARTTALLRRLKKKYGSVPEVVSMKQAAAEEKEQAAAKKAAVPRAAAEEEEEEQDHDDVDFFTAYENLVSGRSASTAEKVVVIGGGPAGLAAVIYAARAGLSPLLVAPAVGGQLLGKGAEVENYPGVGGALGTGPGLVGAMRKQAHGFHTRMLDELVASYDTSTRPFELKLNSSGQSLWAHSLIIATGADSRWLGVEGEELLQGHGVSSCATCDGFLFKGQAAVVIGGGDSAMEDALVLARTSTSVTLIHRRDAFSASHILQQRVKQHPKIRIRWHAVVTAFEGAGRGDHLHLAAVHIKDTVSGKAERLATASAFIAIGHNPNTGLLQGRLDMDDSGYLLVKGRSTHTSVEGIFAAGDVADKVYRQAVTSAGTGAAAALDAERWLSTMGLGAA